MPGVKTVDSKPEMYDIVSSIKELDNCNVIACHFTIDKLDREKITIIADDISKKIVKVDIFIRNNALAWEVKKNIY